MQRMQESIIGEEGEGDMLGSEVQDPRETLHDLDIHDSVLLDM